MIPHSTEQRGEKCVKVGFYDIYKSLGQGNFAIVRLARHRVTKTEVAIKIIHREDTDAATLEKVHREIKIHKTLDHENIIKLYQVMETDNCIYIVTEYAPNGDLFDYIAMHGKMTEPDARHMFWQILRAVDYCHQRGIVHRDLKAENLLLDADMNVKIADFGFGNYFRAGYSLATYCGSPPYAAPEVFEGKSYTGPEVDIWSLGVMLYILVCGVFPFDGVNLMALRNKVVSGRFRIPYFMSSASEHLVRRMLVVDPKKRYTMEQIKDHRWMAGLDLDDTCSMFSSPEEIIDGERVVGKGMPPVTDSAVVVDAVMPSSVNTSSPSSLCTGVVTVSPRPLPLPPPPPHPSPQSEVIVYSDKVLRIMQEAGIDVPKTIQSLKNRAFDNMTAIYYLLLDKLKNQIMQLHNKRMVLESGCRRPSTIADQAVLCVGQRPPNLAETHQGPFSQTTDCVSVQDPGGAVCQIQQRIYTQGGAGYQRGVVGEGGVLGDRQGQVGRALAQAIGGRRIAASIDEGVEIECSEAGSAVGGRPVSGGSSIERLTLEHMRLVPRPDAALLPLQYSGGTPLSGYLAKQLLNYDATIEGDSLSNLSSSFGSLGSATSAGDDNEECMRTADDDPSPSLAAPPTHQGGGSNDAHVDFSEGRRASDGLMAHGIHAFHQQFKAVKSRGIPEMRKELERYRLDAAANNELSETSRRRTTFRGRIGHGGLGQSLDDDGAMGSSPQRQPSRRVTPPNTELHRLMATCHQYHPQVGRPCRPNTDSSSSIGRPCRLPTDSSSFYQQQQLLHQQLPSSFQRLLIDGSSAARAPMSVADDRSLSRGGAAARALYSSVHPAFSTTRSRDCSPNNPPVMGPPRSVMSAPFVPTLGYGVRSGVMYAGIRPRAAVDLFFVPTCRSHDSLAVAAAAEPSQNCESMSLEAIIGRHRSQPAGAAPQHGAGIGTAAAPPSTGNSQGSYQTESADGGSHEEGVHRHMVRRTLYRLVQQQTLTSPPCDEDFIDSSDDIS